MFSNLFEDLIMTDSLAKELERFNALSRKEKEEPKKTETASYHYQQWKDGKPVFERKVEWKDGKKVTDKCIDRGAVIEDKSKDKSKDAPKVAEAPKDTIDPKDIRIKELEKKVEELEKKVEELTNERNNLIRKNADYVTKFAKIKNLF